ncbi:MAG TPA: M14 family metallopeptidase [Patescibacteria group bacterium]|nr:M14 family metallopeptidase [Patescibacteria group bacterium]
MKKITATAFLILFYGLVLPAASKPAHMVRVPLSFDFYYTYDMVVEAMQALHKAYPKLTRLDLVGKSEEGRPVYCLTVNNPKSGTELTKPGIYVDGNIHGNEIQAGEVALYLLDYLLGGYGQNEEITRLVDSRCFYVIPVVNADGRFHFFADANTPNDNRSLRIPHDDDRDGLVDEDFPDDLDKDGNICEMRKRDPFGNFKADPDDARLMVRTKPGEKGEWTLLGDEGIDNDGDGKINEDAEGYLDGNRNWGFDWMPEYVQSGAGEYPFSGSITSDLAKFIEQRPNICVGWTFHNNGGMFLRGPSSKAQGEYPRQDIAVYDYLGQQAERITPGYKYMISWKDLYPTFGDSMEWLTMLQGAYGFVGELFQMETERFASIKESAGGKKAETKEDEEEGGYDFRQNRSLEKERIKFNDHLAQGELYKPWREFDHPDFGKIEIGGWVKMSSRLPAPFMLKDLVHRNASAVIFSAKNTPEISLEIFETKAMGNGLTRVRTRLANARAIPSMSYQARKSKLYPQDTLVLSGAGIKVVAGGEINDIYLHQVAFKKFRPELQFLVVPGFGKVEHEFLVSGTGSLTIAYQSRHAGKLSKSITLK